MRLIIDRKRWLRGGRDGNGVSAAFTLRNPDGHMCCLGFGCEALGVPAKVLNEVEFK